MWSGWEMTLNETSRLPRSATDGGVRRPPRSSSNASISAVSAAPPAARMSSATFASVAGVRPTRWTVAPSRAKARATAPPIDPPPP